MTRNDREGFNRPSGTSVLHGRTNPGVNSWAILIASLLDASTATATTMSELQGDHASGFRPEGLEDNSRHWSASGTPVRQNSRRTPAGRDVIVREIEYDQQYIDTSGRAGAA